MIETKQKYQHKKSDLILKVLTKSIMHSSHWHVGILQNDEVVFTCHVHEKDIQSDWHLINQ